jgi:hypothetical protein
MFRELGAKSGIAGTLEELGYTAQQQGEAGRADRLLGAADGLLEAMGATREPDDRSELDRNVQAVRAQLGEEAFAVAWAEGWAMTLEQASLVFRT